MVELKKVYNFDIGDVHEEYKTIYLICDQNSTTLEHLINEFNRLDIPVSEQVRSVLDNIVTNKVYETLVNVDNMYNVVISLFRIELHNTSGYLLKSLIANNIRNINLILLTDDLEEYYSFAEGLIIQLYNMSISSVIYPNIFVNYLNQELSRYKMQEILYTTKSIFICKKNTVKELENLHLEPKIKLKEEKNMKYLEYNGTIDTKKKMVIIGNINVVYSLITMYSLLRKRFNIKGYLSDNYPEKIPKSTMVIYVNVNKMLISPDTPIGDRDSILAYNGGVAAKLIKPLIEESSKLSFPVRYTKIDDTGKIINFNTYSNCLAVRLFGVFSL